MYVLYCMYIVQCVHLLYFKYSFSSPPDAVLMPPEYVHCTYGTVHSRGTAGIKGLLLYIQYCTFILRTVLFQYSSSVVPLSVDGRLFACSSTRIYKICKFTYKYVLYMYYCTLYSCSPWIETNWLWVYDLFTTVYNNTIYCTLYYNMNRIRCRSIVIRQLNNFTMRVVRIPSASNAAGCIH